jgi:MFS family permease
MTAVPAAARPRFAALHSRNFRLLWAGLIISNAGSQMQAVAQGYLVYYTLTHSTFWLGMVSLSFALPMILFPLFGGAIADRVDKLTLLKFTQCGQMLSSALITAVTLSGHVSVGWILLTSFVGATFLAADNPARQALLPELVAREDLVSAAALNGATYTGAALIGPALGGVLLPVFTAGGLFLLNTVSFLAVLIALFQMREVNSRPHGVPASVGRSLQEVGHYVKTAPAIGLLLALSAVVGLFGRSYLPLTPAFARDLLHTDARGLGFLYAAPGLGALIGAGLLGARRVTSVSRRVLIGAILAFAVLLIAYSFNPWYPLALLLLTGTGITSQVGATMISTTLQLQAPGRLRGRVMSIYAITIIGLASLGALGSGAAAEVTGPGVAVAGGAVLMGVTALLIAPRIRGVDHVSAAPAAGAPTVAGGLPTAENRS